tara:strand:- start:285 stop:449 length:165 start_codon:yes stop_codon:yes gene_type:complete
MDQLNDSYKKIILLICLMGFILCILLHVAECYYNNIIHPENNDENTDENNDEIV